MENFIVQDPIICENGRNGHIFAACGGTERPFTVNGRRWLYCYQPTTGRHCYLNLDTDIASWHRSFHPVTTPEFEFCEEEVFEPSGPKVFHKSAVQICGYF